MANYHVVREEAGKWKILREGAERVSVYEDTQRKAEMKAKRLAGNMGGGEVKIHGLDGKIRDSDTVPPANDPFPPKDNVH